MELHKIPSSPPEIVHKEIKDVNLETPTFVADRGDEMSNSPFAKMFINGATKKELTQFINNCLYPILHECRRAEAAAKRASRRFLASVTGKRYVD